MRKLIIIILFLMCVPIVSGAQFTYSGYIYNANGSGAVNFPVKLYKRTTTTTITTNTNTSVKIFKTHAGNGSTSQYANWPTTRSEMDKLFNTAYSNTTLYWSGTISASSSLNFWSYSTLTSAGASVPPNGDFYSTEVTFTFTPKETGAYSFGLTSDDGSDLWLVGYGSVIEWYGGKGMGGYVYGTVNLTKGTSYTFITRMQEYQGGDGLYLYWKRPSQSTYSLQTDEVGATTTTTTTSSWALDATAYTNSSGYYSFSRTSNTGDEWYLQLDAVTPTTTLTLTDVVAPTDVILSRVTKKSIHYNQFDANGDGTISISDAYYINKKRYATASAWPSIYLYTSSQYTSLITGTLDLRGSVIGSASITINNPVSGTTTGNYYIIAPGYKGQVSY